MHILRSAPAGRQPLRLRAVPRGKARTRPPALCRAQGCRLLRALHPAHGRRSVALRPVPRAGEGARLPRAGKRCRQEALCRPARQRHLRRLQGACRWRRPLPPLRIPFQFPRSRASSRVDVAAADRRDRTGDRRRAGSLRDRVRGRRLHRLRSPAPRPGGDTFQRPAPGSDAGMSAERPHARRRRCRTCGRAPNGLSRSRAVAGRSTHKAARRFIRPTGGLPTAPAAAARHAPPQGGPDPEDSRPGRCPASLSQAGDGARVGQPGLAACE